MPKDNPQGYKYGRNHPASKPIPSGSGEGRSKFGRDTIHGRFPANDAAPTKIGGRDHPASKGPEVPKMSDPMGRE